MSGSRRLIALLLALIGPMPVFAQTSLRAAAAQRGLLVGAAADYSHLGETDYTTVLGREYSVLEPENDMKWATIHPNPPGSANEYNFVPGDALVSFARAHQMKVRGHNLCWYSYNPAWLTNGNYTPAQLSQIFQNHITTAVSHYRGQVFAWDVVNEALDDSTGQLRDSIWYNQPGIGQTGFGYIAQAFQWAHQADPQALLFYNDYNVEDASTAKSNAMYAMLKTLLSQGVPIGGVGLQLHITTDPSYISPSGLDANVARLAALGLQVHFTELDVRIPVDSNGVATSANLQAQAQRYHDVVAVCLKYPGCTLAQTWGFTDKYSWIPGSFPGYGAALPFDASYQLKPAYTALQQLLSTTPPVLAATNIVNAANYQSGAVSPGEIVTIFGANYGPAAIAGAQFNSSGELSGNVAGVQVQFDNKIAPIVYALVNQTSVIVPFEVSGQTSVTYSYQGVQSNTVTLPVTAVTPALFTSDASGTGEGAILNQDLSLNSTANPAAVGSIVVLYGTGSGVLSGPVTDGEIIQAPLPALAANITASVGGLPGTVKYQGPAPSLVAGVFQVNVQLPATLGSGPQRVVLMVGGVATQHGLTVAVK